MTKEIHIGYDHECLSVEFDGKTYRGHYEDCSVADALKEAFEALGHKVTTELEY